MRAAETVRAGGSPFSEVIMKKHTPFLIAAFFTAVFASFYFSACGGPNIVEENKQNDEGFLPPLPPAAEREPVTEDDIFGDYDGAVIPVMNGIKFPNAVQEKIRIKKSSQTPPTIMFITREQTPYQKIMHNLGLSYTFKEITLVPAADGRAYFFSGTGGDLRMHDSPTETIEQGHEVSTNTALEKGSVYKKGGELYISYIVVYDMADIREMIPLLPENHKSLVAVMQKGEKK